MSRRTGQAGIRLALIEYRRRFLLRWPTAAGAEHLEALQRGDDIPVSGWLLLRATGDRRYGYGGADRDARFLLVGDRLERQ